MVLVTGLVYENDALLVTLSYHPHRCYWYYAFVAISISHANQFQAFTLHEPAGSIYYPRLLTSIPNFQRRSVVM